MRIHSTYVIHMFLVCKLSKPHITASIIPHHITPSHSTALDAACLTLPHIWFDNLTFRKDSKNVPNLKIMKNTERTFLQTKAVLGSNYKYKLWNSSKNVCPSPNRLAIGGPGLRALRHPCEESWGQQPGWMWWEASVRRPHPLPQPRMPLASHQLSGQNHP